MKEKKLLPFLLPFLLGLLISEIGVQAQSGTGEVPVEDWYKAETAGILFTDSGNSTVTYNLLVSQWNDATPQCYNLVQTVEGISPAFFLSQSKRANFNLTSTFMLDYIPVTRNEVIDRVKGTLYVAGYFDTIMQSGFFSYEASNDFSCLHEFAFGGINELLLFYNRSPCYQNLMNNAFLPQSYFTSAAGWQKRWIYSNLC